MKLTTESEEGARINNLGGLIAPRISLLQEVANDRGRTIFKWGKNGSQKRANSTYLTPRGSPEARMETDPINLPITGGLGRSPAARVTGDAGGLHSAPPVEVDTSIPLGSRNQDTPIGLGTTSRRGGAPYDGSSLVQLVAVVREIMKLESRDRRHQKREVEPPPRFDGTKVHEWLAQIENYFTQLGFDDEERLIRAPSFLTGRALSYWYTIQTRSTSDVPRSWADFCTLMSSRFGGRTTGETIRLLQELEYQGDLEEVANKFGDILAEGEPLPPIEELQLFVTRFPKEMMVPVMRQKPETWVDARELLRRQIGEEKELALMWYRYTTPGLRKQAERDPKLRQEGWLPISLAKAREDGRGINYRELNSRAGQGQTNELRKRHFTRDDRRRENQEIKCHICSGQGHIARNCPNTKLDKLRVGQRCHKCGGYGHWSSSCSSGEARGMEGNHARVGGNWNDVKREREYRNERQGNGKA